MAETAKKLGMGWLSDYPDRLDPRFTPKDTLLSEWVDTGIFKI
jgi:hypothetical protein